jgi:hypothetical protein
VLTEDNHLSTGNGLLGIDLLQEDIGGRTARAAFGGEQLNQNRMGCCARGLIGRGRVLDWLALPVGGRRYSKE